MARKISITAESARGRQILFDIAAIAYPRTACKDRIVDQNAWVPTVSHPRPQSLGWITLRIYDDDATANK